MSIRIQRINKISGNGTLNNQGRYYYRVLLTVLFILSVTSKQSTNWKSKGTLLFSLLVHLHHMGIWVSYGYWEIRTGQCNVIDLVNCLYESKNSDWFSAYLLSRKGSLHHLSRTLLLLLSFCSGFDLQRIAWKLIFISELPVK